MEARVTVTAAGTLFIVATPIGNMEDITLRALRTLREAGLIACEDTRHTANLLRHHGIDRPTVSYHEHNEAARTRLLLDELQRGRNVALVSDAGLPLVSDPGYRVVQACREAGIRVTVVPGPSAALAALAGSGLPTDAFFFAGFLPARAGQRRKRLEEIASIDETLVFYEAPHRILEALEDMLAILGPRRATIARELTKLHEEWLSGSIGELLEALRPRPKIPGELTIVVAGGQPAAGRAPLPCSVREHVELEMRRSGLSRKDALKAAARARGISRREAYSQLLEEESAETGNEDRG